MSTPLPPILPIGGQGANTHAPSVSQHAIDTSVLKLQQKKDVEGARVSMNQVVSGQAGHHGATTSVSHMGEGAEGGAVSSVAHIGEAREGQGEDARYSAGADERRYGYIRRLIKARQEKEQNAHPIPAGVGASFSTKKFTKKLRSYIASHPGTYRNISLKDRNYFAGLVGKYAKKRTTGTGFSLTTRKRMKYETEKARRAGKITLEDKRDFGKIIDDMKN